MKINITTNEIIKKIKFSLDNKTPLLITRFGEGEMRMFLNNHESEWIIKTMLSYVPEPKVMDEIRNNLEIALVNSDITGLPSYDGFTDEETIMKTELHFLYKEIYNQFRRIFESHDKNESEYDYCDVNVHSKFQLEQFSENLLNDLDELVIITCRDVSEKLKNKFRIKNIKVYTIPPEYRFEDNPEKIKWNFYPEIHNQIKLDILSNDNRGKLCLYGAGVAGKDLGYYFKQSGGVAFDIGSVFDYWFGKKTRGPGKGKNVYFKSNLE